MSTSIRRLWWKVPNSGNPYWEEIAVAKVTNKRVYVPHWEREGCHTVLNRAELEAKGFSRGFYTDVGIEASKRGNR